MIVRNGLRLAHFMPDEAKKDSNGAFYECLRAQRELFGRDEKKVNASLGVVGHAWTF